MVGVWRNDLGDLIDDGWGTCHSTNGAGNEALGLGDRNRICGRGRRGSGLARDARGYTRVIRSGLAFGPQGNFRIATIYEIGGFDHRPVLANIDEFLQLERDLVELLGL